MHIQSSQILLLTDGTPYIEASDLHLAVGKWPEYIEVVEGDYVIDRYINPHQNWDNCFCGECLPDLLSVDYTSTTGKKLFIIND
jgi:hypothetical protein